MDADKKDALKFTIVDVERLNVVDPDGTLRMALFNARNFPGVTTEDKVLDRQIGNRTAGMLFYNESGEECGGLVFGDGEAGLLFDQYHQDQVIGVTYGQDAEGRNEYGMVLWDRPDMPLGEWMQEWSRIQSLPEGNDRDRAEKEFKASDLWGKRRAYIGKSSDGEVGVTLSDSKGRTRIRMVIGADDMPRLEFLDEAGNLAFRLPPGSRSND